MKKLVLFRFLSRKSGTSFRVVVIGLLAYGLANCWAIAQTQAVRPAQRFRTPATLPLTKFYDAPRPLPPGKAGELIRSEPNRQYSLPFELSALRILYHSRTARGEDVAVSGVVLIPDGKAPAGGWPVIAWAHEFRGAARQCAPSLMKNLGAGPILAMYANLGYALVATDYSGLGSDLGKSVEDMQSNALDLMYSIPAARAAVPEIGTKLDRLGNVSRGPRCRRCGGERCTRSELLGKRGCFRAIGCGGRLQTFREGLNRSHARLSVDFAGALPGVFSQ